MRQLFTEHPASVGETYGQHMASAFGFAGAMFAASLACFLHGIFPWLFRTTGSRTIVTLHERMIAHRVRGSAHGAPSNGTAAGD